MYIKSKLLTWGITLTLSTLHSFALTADVPTNIQLAERQELVRNNLAEPQSLDPHKIEGVAEFHLARDLFEGLVIVNIDGDLEPRIADSWEHQDYKVWRFNLKKGLQWSNGDPLTAHDFVYSWQRLADPATASPYASYLQYTHIDNGDDIIKGDKTPETLGVKALDDFTLEVTLTEPIPYFPKLLAHSVMAPVPQKVIATYGNDWTKPDNFVGNGAYKLAAWIVNEHIILQRNSAYWADKDTVINQVTYLPIASEITDVNRYRSGEIDLTASIPIELYTKLKAEIPHEIKNSPYLCTYYYGINNQRPPFTDKRVREALKLGLDQNLIVNVIKNQGDLPAYSFTPPYIADLTIIQPEWFTWTQEARNTKAKALLKEAGFDAANPLFLSLLYNTSDMHKKLAIATASMWKKNLGVQVKLENQEWKVYTDTRHQGNYDVVRASWCADYDEPTAFLNMMLSDSSVNTVHYQNQEFDALMAKSIQATDEETRQQLYQAAEKQLDDTSAIVPLYYYANLRLVKPYVGGYTGKNSLGYVYTKDLYIIQH